MAMNILFSYSFTHPLTCMHKQWMTKQQAQHIIYITEEFDKFKLAWMNCKW